MLCSNISNMTEIENSRPFYSALRLFTGFANAAFTDWKLTVASAITTERKPAAKNIHQLISIL